MFWYLPSHENFSEDSQSLGWDLNPGPPVYEACVMPLWQGHLICILISKLVHLTWQATGHLQLSLVTKHILCQIYNVYISLWFWWNVRCNAIEITSLKQEPHDAEYTHATWLIRTFLRSSSPRSSKDLTYTAVESWNLAKPLLFDSLHVRHFCNTAFKQAGR